MNERSSAEYVYVLGLYLGDGYISRAGRTFRLRITLDARHHEIIAAACRALGVVFPKNSVGVVPRAGAVDVSVHSNKLLALLPQHGPGRKHERAIELTAWQRRLVIDHPRAFVKGLFDSDGSYFLNPVKSQAGRYYVYERYMFTNKSCDIRDLFSWACELIGVETRQASHKNISVARRDSVAILNEFLGPKR